VHAAARRAHHGDCSAGDDQPRPPHRRSVTPPAPRPRKVPLQDVPRPAAALVFTNATAVPRRVEANASSPPPSVAGSRSNRPGIPATRHRSIRVPRPRRRTRRCASRQTSSANRPARAVVGTCSPRWRTSRFSRAARGDQRRVVGPCTGTWRTVTPRRVRFARQVAAA